ncbi:cytochrome P450 [Pseudovirgaria hyperparasitica]|uniref:Cytochrome P450 n=1 Tax=Pseudovirgaria hyperparasitica TaxID=470096 RepID=A0A6A6WHZ3_9PEZI|nr:cytochrome P450 [Pseudovirgaria hyperparasitica]KAF2761616.1 cytochrome P450 [Pseudovirgaria hyperparasitica]
MVVWSVYQTFLSPLSSVPGPFWAKFSRIWITYHAYIGDMHRVMMALHNEHGELVRVAPNELSTSSLSAIKTIYGPGSKFRKSDWYSVWQGHRKFDLFAERSESVHSTQRRFVARAYAMESLKDFGPYVDDAIRVLLAQLTALNKHRNSIDLGLWIQLFAFDIIGEITFSKRFGFLDVGADDHDGSSFAQITAAMRSASWIGQYPALFWLHEYLVQPVLGNKLAINMRHGSIRTFAQREIIARADRGSDHADMLDKLNKVHVAKPRQFSSADVASMVTSNIFAGSDTTAISVRSIVFHLLTYPACKARLMAEIDERKGAGELSDPVTFEEASGMPYLQAVIYEALRLHPAIGMNMPRVVPPGDGLTIGQVCVPPGAVVGANAWVTGRDKTVYGEDADEFRPERWMGEDTGDLHRYFFAFGGGARMCIGRNVSWLEMSKLIPTLFQHFDMELVEPDKPLTEVCWWVVPLCNCSGV